MNAQTFTTRTDAIDAIREAIEATGEAAEFDLDKIADQVILGDGAQGFTLAEPQEFWAAVEANALTTFKVEFPDEPSERVATR